MDRDRYAAGSCPLGRGLAVVGDGWSMLILRDAARGIARFDAFRQSLGIAPNILARRLATLAKDGLLARRRYSERPPREEYVLTEAGRDFLPVLQVLAAWGRKHNGAGAVSRIVDGETGEPIEPVVIDRRTGAPLGTRPVRVEPAADHAATPLLPSREKVARRSRDG